MEISHASSAVQFAALEAGDLDLAWPGSAPPAPDTTSCWRPGSPSLWPAALRRRDLAAFNAALDTTMPESPGNDGESAH